MRAPSNRGPFLCLTRNEPVLSATLMTSRGLPFMAAVTSTRASDPPSSVDEGGYGVVLEEGLLGLIGGRDAPTPPWNRRVLSDGRAGTGVVESQARAPLRVSNDRRAKLRILG